jgi:GDP/UDP-N,N'-diacetylbacillosamine 2-epimerase (hydrolysing)
VIDCDPEKMSVTTAIEKLFSKDFQAKLKTVKNPYGDGKASNRIIEILKNEELPKEIKKQFYDI